MKRLLFILPLFIACTIVSGQTFRVGAMAGITITDVEGVSGTGLVEFHKPGFTVGGQVSTKIGPKTQVQMEICFTQRGSEVFPDSTHTNFYYDLNLNYIDISLEIRQSLHIRVNNKLSDKYGVLAGGTYGPLVGYSYTVQGIIYNLDQQLNFFDANVFFGFYYNFTDNFFFDMRYSNSFIPAYKHNATTQGFYPFYNSWEAGNNMGFELRFGYRFGHYADETNTNATPPPAPAN